MGENTRKNKIIKQFWYFFILSVYNLNYWLLWIYFFKILSYNEYFSVVYDFYKSTPILIFQFLISFFLPFISLFFWNEFDFKIKSRFSLFTLFSILPIFIWILAAYWK